MNQSPYDGHVITNENLIHSENKLFESNEKVKTIGLLKTLNDIGIFEHEQLYSISKTPSSRLLKNQLSMNDSQFELLLNNTLTILGNDKISKINNTNVPNYGLGAIKPNNELLKENLDMGSDYEIIADQDFWKDFPFIKRKIDQGIEDALINIPESGICSYHQNIPIKNQGQRGTCTAFALTFTHEIFQLYINKNLSIDLSEQYLYYKAKLIEGDNNCGAYLKSVINVLINHGQCLEIRWPYNPISACNDHGKKPLLVDSDALSRKPICIKLKNGIDIFKAIINLGGTISFSIPVYDSWVKSPEVKLTGRITMPIKDEKSIDGHSMVIIGYQNNSNFPGGGYFIIRNSWGTAWASESPYGSGVGIIPYKYVIQNCWESYSMIWA